MRKRTALLLLVLSTVAGVLFFWPRPPPHSTEKKTSKAQVHAYKPPKPNLIVPPKPALNNAPVGWRPFTPPDSYILRPFVIEPSLAQRLPCIDQWVSQGKPCAATDHGKIDAVWTWVNGSEAILDAVRNRIAAANTKPGPRALPFAGTRSTHFRTHGEMVHSMRSVLKSLPAALVNKYIVLTADVAADDTETLRLGSVPTWLNMSRDDGVRVLHHSDVFRTQESSTSTTDKGREWRDHMVPSFNSLAIESQLANIPDLATTLFYLNDDCFVLRPLSAGDFETPLYGPVFRIQFDLGVKGKPPGSSTMGVDREGEWPGLQFTNWLLDQRFGKRERRYLHHVAKALPAPIMREAAAVWADEIAKTAEARFRGQGPQVNLVYLTTWYTIEKHRESLLYSFLMLRVDADADGVISPAERLTLLDGLESGRVTVALREGGSAHWLELNMKRAGVDPPKETEYEWLSSDGYPLIHTIIPKDKTPQYCTIDVVKCFAGDAALEVFHRVAFEQPECGDCLIAHLVGKSGPTGLATFLPPPDPRKAAFPRTPSLAKTWQDATYPFGMGREYAVNSIQRYTYVLGASPMQFLELRRTSDTRKLPDTNTSVALLAVNDDLRNPLGVEQTDRDIRMWYGRHWGGMRAWWENK
ncbi:hypothetical protein C8R47DRAFT_222143 [Mycena vitilis]|nr:hypothetical protein C8R47DRAFT_222143 [Mycena vitilis]